MFLLLTQSGISVGGPGRHPHEFELPRPGVQLQLQQEAQCKEHQSSRVVAEVKQMTFNVFICAHEYDINRFCRSSSLSAAVKSTESSLSVSFGGNLEAVINLDFQFRGEVGALAHNSAPSFFTFYFHLTS